MVGGSVLPQTHYLIPPNSYREGLEVAHKQRGCCPSLLRRSRSMEELKQMHVQLIKLGQDGDPRYASSLIISCALSDWGSMDYAVSVFRQMEHPTALNLNTLTRGFLRRSNPDAALLLYREMQEEGDLRPDNFTFTFLLKACAHLSAAREGAQVHGHAYKHGFQSDLFLQNSMISMYGKCGEVQRSIAVFEQMGLQRNVASWSALLAAHTRAGLWEECLGLYGRMSSEGWRPDESALVSVLSASTHLGSLEIGRCAHCCLLRTAGVANTIAQTALIDLYIKCGCLDRGLSIFRGMERERKNLWTYSVVISGLAMHGDGKKALWLFSDMVAEGLRPDGTVYVGVLTACSRAGLVAEGLRCFDRMRFEHGIAPTHQHYACLVDLVARAGRLEEALDLIMSMPTEPNAVIWRCLLGACRVHRNAEIGELAGRKLLELEQEVNAGDYVLMSSIYARAGKWPEAARARTAVVDGGWAQVPGCSIVEAKGEVHTFVSQDRRHPESRRIYEMLYQMGWQLRFEGYCPDTSEVVVAGGGDEEEEKRRILGGHSQKLALAFGLISTEAGEPIRIVKNTRMCRDCHEYTKLVSKIFDREIAVRERNRLHHFRDGRCSCGDLLVT